MQFKKNIQTIINLTAISFVTYKAIEFSSCYAGWLLPITPTILGVNSTVGNFFTPAWAGVIFVANNLISSNYGHADNLPTKPKCNYRVAEFVTKGLYGIVYSATGLLTYGFVVRMCSDIPVFNRIPLLNNLIGFTISVLACSTLENVQPKITKNIFNGLTNVDSALQYINNKTDTLLNYAQDKVNSLYSKT